VRAPSLALALVLAAGTSGAVPYVEEEHFDVGKVRGSFLMNGFAARPVSMGGAYTALADDASAVFWNPGGLGQLTTLDVVVSHNYFDEDTGTSFMAVAVPVGAVRVGAGFVFVQHGPLELRDASGNLIGSEEPSDTCAFLSIAFGGPKRLFGLDGWIGLGAELVNEYASGGSMAGFNVGGVHPVASNGTVGWSVRHVGMSDEGFSLPGVCQLGGAFDVVEGMKIALDGMYGLVDKNLGLGIGSEIRPGGPLALRLGYKKVFSDQEIEGLRGVTAGIGLHWGRLGFDYAYQPFGDLAVSHRVTLVYGLRATAPIAATVGRGAPSKAIAEHKKMAMSPESFADVLDAYRPYYARDYDTALEKAERIVKDNPDDWEGWRLLGNCRFSKGDKRGAIKSYKRALKLNPDAPQLRAWLEVLEKTGKGETKEK